MNNQKIKFRVWLKFSKEMIPVDSINFKSKIINENSAWRFLSEVELMQFTGLYDKNGKEIYESDILEVVRFRNTASGYYTEKLLKEAKIDHKYGFLPSFFEDTETVEVIGNIFENPELLK